MEQEKDKNYEVIFTLTDSDFFVVSARDEEEAIELALAELKKRVGDTWEWEVEDVYER